MSLKQDLSAQLFKLLQAPDPEKQEQAIAAINGQLQIPVRDFPGPQQPEATMYGVVWSSYEEEIAQTGYVFKTTEEARQAGIRGCQWFSDPQGREVEDVVGVQVDWTAQSAALPVSFFIDTEDDKYAEYDLQGHRLQFCRKCGQELHDEGGVLVDPTGGDVCGADLTNDPHVLDYEPSTATCDICGATADYDSEFCVCPNCVKGCVSEPAPDLAEPSDEALLHEIQLALEENGVVHACNGPGIDRLCKLTHSLEQQVASQQETLEKIARLAGQFTGVRHPQEDRMKATLARICQLAVGQFV